MRNVTIVLDDQTARWARVEAARADTSVSRFVGELLRREMQQSEAYAQAADSYLGRASATLKSRGGYPSRDSLHER